MYRSYNTRAAINVPIPIAVHATGERLPAPLVTLTSVSFISGTYAPGGVESRVPFQQ